MPGLATTASLSQLMLWLVKSGGKEEDEDNEIRLSFPFLTPTPALWEKDTLPLPLGPLFVDSPYHLLLLYHLLGA